MADNPGRDASQSVIAPAGQMLLNWLTGSTGQKTDAGMDMHFGSLFGGPMAPGIDPRTHNLIGPPQGAPHTGGGSPAQTTSFQSPGGQPHSPGVTRGYQNNIGLGGTQIPMPGPGGSTMPTPQFGAPTMGGGAYPGYVLPYHPGGGAVPERPQTTYDPRGFMDASGALAQLAAGQGVAGISPEMTNALYASTANWLGTDAENTMAYSDALGNVRDRALGAAAGGGFGYRNPDGGLANTRALYDEMRSLQNESAKDLIASIDAEASSGIASQLPEVEAQMQAAGLGRSGAHTSAAGGVVADIMGQANRDKIRAMTDLEEANLARLQNTLLTGEDLRLRGLGMEADTSAQAINQLQNIHSFTDGLKRQRMYDMLGIGEQQRAIQQQMLNQSFDTRMMPLSLLLQMATGSPARPVASPQASNPWAGVGAQVGGQVVGGLMGGGGGYRDQYFGGTA